LPTIEIEELSIWTIYDHPRDYPEGFIARRWAIANGQNFMTSDTFKADNLETLRRHFEGRALFRMPRQDGDDRVIVESWL
jgi:hypothetical protein